MSADRRISIAHLFVVAAAFGLMAPPSVQAAQKPNRLNQALAKLKIPPAWMKAQKISWDYKSIPWKKGRQEIRRLLGFSTLDGNRQAMKLTYLYKLKKDIGDGHEMPMYTFLSRETAWSVKAHEAFLLPFLTGKKPTNYYYAHRHLAKC